jgi:hypothetical protein
MMKSVTLLFLTHLLFIPALFAIETNQLDSFQDGTLKGWGSGAPNPNPPVIVLDGGPTGTGDAYLRIASNGSGAAGGRLVVFNTSQWTGNYTNAGVSHISMHMNNFSNEALVMRVVLQGSGGIFWTTNPVSLPVNSGWQIVQFSVQSADLTGDGNVNTTLSNVTQFRIIHNVSGTGNVGDIITATLGIDNITAAETPLPVELTSFTAGLTGKTVTLNWTTASEMNNHGFEIQRAAGKRGPDVAGWRKIGFKNGAGTTNEKRLYTFFDNVSGISNEFILYRLKQLDFDGSFKYSDKVIIENNLPFAFSLEQNYPNPFNPATVISYQLGIGTQVTLKIYDVLGNEVATLVNEEKPAGTYELKWNGQNNFGEELTSGIYFYKMETILFSASRKMILLR